MTDLIRVQEFANGIPPGFWTDPYVLGYFAGTIHMLARLTTRDHLDKLDHIIVKKTVFHKVLGTRGSEVWDNFLAANDPPSESLVAGLENAMKLVAIMYGSHEFDSDDDVGIARENANRLGASMAAMLGQLYYTEYLRRRFGS